MLTFIGKRVVSGIVLIWSVCTLVFVLLYFNSGNVARTILGQTASQEAVDLKSAQLGLDRPLTVQYVDWLSHALHGDLGTSWFTNQPVTSTIATRLPVTLSIIIGATIVSAIIAVVLGVWAAIRRGWADRVVQVLSVLGFAVPGFLIAIGLIAVFALNFGWFAPTGFVAFTDSPSGWLRTVTLPIIALSIGGIAAISGQIRGSMLDAMRQDYVRTLRSRGLSSTQVTFVHVLRNAAGPALAVLALQFIGMLGGVVLIEQIFAIPGVGQMTVLSTIQGDIPVVMGLVAVTAILVVVVNLAIDLVQGWVTPRARLA
ncbi:ABC transporter permease [Cellulomonas sp. McL0617]|uniref:ABC transporter permease n=1 Tax=Cellulomonas sp. McL0617 TaxID=3415675 RepID=UPI003CEBE914